VKSGFTAVAEYVSKYFLIPTEESLIFMLKALTQGRGRIFDDMLLQFGLYSKQNVKKCLKVYRSHKPDIKLYHEADECLERLKQFPIYIVTDGNKLVQYNKIVALQLQNRVKSYFITHRHGVAHAKPSPYCFSKICEREKVGPCQVVYIGDNPHKDFCGIKPLGFKTIRILQGQYKDVVKSVDFDAEYHLTSLSELSAGFIKEIFSS